jgi:hypothetical protein
MNRVARDGFVHVADVRETDGYRNDPQARQRFDVQGVRTWLAVALQKEGNLLGTIHVHRSEVRPFTENQIALLQNFAAQAVIAMENARLITETREALEQQTATAEVLGVINSSPGDLAPVFEVMLEKALELCGAAFGCLWTYDGEYFHRAALYDEDARGAAPYRPLPGMDDPMFAIAQGERIVNIADQRTLDVYRDNPVARRISTEPVAAACS